MMKSWKKQKQKMFNSWEGTLVQLSDFTNGKTGQRESKWLVHDDAYPWESFYTNRVDKIDLGKIQNNGVDIVPWGHKPL